MYGNEPAVDEELKNNASQGAAIYNDEGTAQFGRHIGDSWQFLGNLDTTDNTIRVVNGVLQ